MKKEKKPLSIRWQLIIVNLIVVIITLVAGTAISLTYYVNTMEKQLESELHTVALMLSKTETVIETLKVNEPNQELNDYIDQIIMGNTDIDVITVADMNGIRVYHIDKEKIGESFVGGDDIDVREGKHYASKAYGTLGYQLRYFYPVYDEADNQIGFVMTSALMSKVESMKNNIVINMIRFSFIVLIIGISLAVLLAERIKISLIGYEPSQIARLLTEREEIFDSLEEGLLAINNQGEIIFANKAALAILNLETHEIQEKKSDAIISQIRLMDTIKTGLPANNLSTIIYNRDIIYDKLPIKDKTKVVGALAVMRNRTELKQLAQQLTGVNHFIDSLKANNHEFMNKLHIILGLLQIGAIKDAENYITELSNRQGMIVNTITERIENRRIAALLLGKISRGNELNIKVKLMPNSYLPNHSKFLSTDSLVTIIGNLIENAMDAINCEENDDLESEEISIFIYEDDSNLVISVDDTGIGMTEETIANIKKGRFSTKGSGRGTGMTLIKNIVENSEGELTIDSKKDIGTSIVVIIKKKRNLGGTKKSD
jgi:two-component system sensor histidine kinase DctS